MRLRKITLAAKQAEEAKAKRKADRANRDAAGQLERRLKEWPVFISEEIEKAARAGKFEWTFDCGNCEEKVTSMILKKFADLHPRFTQVERQEVVNYDLGTYSTYFVRAVVFSW